MTLSGLATNTIYTFRYRVLNKHGWSSFSSHKQILTATVPAVMTNLVIEYSSAVPTNIEVTWAAPYNGGNPITSYQV
jgi:hypothetical protein